MTAQARMAAVAASLKQAPRFAGCLPLLDASLLKAPPEGLVLEFGVGAGQTTNRLAINTSRTVYGFDSFRGLPEDWDRDNPKGKFDRGGKLPEVRGNVTLVPGWFDETVAPFLREKGEKVAFAHVDCDLYSSTRTVLGAIARYLLDGAVLNFNEFWDYPDAHRHEALAFAEFLETGWACECIGRSSQSYSQAAFVVRRV